MDSQMVDREPHRSVQLIRRIDTRIPANLLSQTVVTSGTLGKLADLRAPARAALPASSPAPTPAGSGSPRVSRGWNSVLAHPRAETPPPPHAPSSGLSARTGPGASRSTTPSQPVSNTPSWATPGASRSATPLPVASQPVVAAATVATSSSEAVPDNWEDDDV